MLLEPLMIKLMAYAMAVYGPIFTQKCLGL